jgi:hypothetical protein
MINKLSWKKCHCSEGVCVNIRRLKVVTPVRKIAQHWPEPEHLSVEALSCAAHASFGRRICFSNGYSSTRDASPEHSPVISTSFSSASSSSAGVLLKSLVHTSRNCCKPHSRLYFWLQIKQHVSVPALKSCKTVCLILIIKSTYQPWYALEWMKRESYMKDRVDRLRWMETLIVEFWLRSNQQRPYG